MGFLSIFILIGSIQSILLAIVFLFHKKGLQSKMLGVVLATISIALFIAYLQLNIDFRIHPYLIKTNLTLSLIFMPVLYLYLQLLTGSINKITKSQIIYFIPFLIIFIYNIPFYFGSVSNKIEYYIRVDLNGNQTLLDKIEDLFVNGFVFLFSILAIIEVRNYRKRALNVFSDLQKAKIKWIFFLAFAMLFLSSIAFFLLILQFIFPGEISPAFNFITAIGSTTLIFFIAYIALINPNVFTAISSEVGVLTEPEINETLKRDKEALIHQNILSKINSLITEEKIYKNPELTLSELSQKVNAPAYLVSKVISTTMKTNFFTLINNSRIEEVKKELIIRDGKGIMEIAYQSGFNSKSTFYEAFKKSTGLSPSEFIKQNTSE